MHTTKIEFGSQGSSLVATECAASVQKRICSFLDLRQGWHYGDGAAISPDTKDTALSVSEIFADGGAKNIEAFPCVGGEILVSGYHGSKTVDVLCCPCGILDITLEEKDAFEEERTNQNLDDLKELLKGLMWEPKTSFACFTPNISVKSWDGLRVQRSRSLQMAGFPSSIEIVLSVKADASVSTLGITTKVLPGTRQFCGRSMSPHSRRGIALHASNQQVEIPVTGTFAP